MQKVRILKYLIAVCVIIIIAITIFVPESDSKSVPYSITDTDSTSRALILRITIDHRTTEDTLAWIANKIKEERNWNEKLVCFFYIQVPSNSYAWASYSFLPKCDDCTVDDQGNKIEFNLIGMKPSLADSLRQLTLDTIENKTLLASYLEDIWKCKTQLYKIQGNSERVLLARLFSQNEFTLTWLDEKIINKETRYYHQDQDSKYYIVINNNNNSIDNFNSDGLLWQSDPMLK